MHIQGDSELEFSDTNGNPISEKEWDKKGGRWYITAYSDGKYYHASGTAIKKRKQWTSDAEVEEYEF